MSNERPIGTSIDPSMEVDIDELGAPGVRGILIIEAQFADDRFTGKDRINDKTPRTFVVRSRLSRLPQDQFDLRGDIKPSEGSSFLIMPPGKQAIEITFKSGVVTLEANERGEISTASARVMAATADEARMRFLDMLTRYLDRAAYLYAVPAHLGLLNVNDEANEVQHIYFTAPPRPVVIKEGGENLSDDMKAVYALYREAMNSASPYYRVLCLYKIMEGLLGPLGTALHKRARKAGVDVSTPRASVPDHRDFPTGLRGHVGKPIKEFFDRFLTRQHRDAVAHFELRTGPALDLSSQPDFGRFVDVAFVADLTVRVLIARHEARLQKFELRSQLRDI